MTKEGGHMITENILQFDELIRSVAQNSNTRYSFLLGREHLQNQDFLQHKSVFGTGSTRFSHQIILVWLELIAILGMRMSEKMCKIELMLNLDFLHWIQKCIFRSSGNLIPFETGQSFPPVREAIPLQTGKVFNICYSYFRS